MEGDGHNSIRRIKCLFNTVAMVNIYVDVKDAVVVLEQLQDAQHDVVHVAESAGLLLLGMVESSRPINGYIGRLMVEFDSRINRSSSGDLAELKHTLEARAVILTNFEVRGGCLVRHLR